MNNFYNTFKNDKYKPANLLIKMVKEDKVIVKESVKEPVKEVLKEEKKFVKETEKLFYKNANKYRKVCAYMLANEYHPLVENKEVFRILNSNAFSDDTSISFQQCHYIYNESTKHLSIAE